MHFGFTNPLGLQCEGRREGEKTGHGATAMVCVKEDVVG